MVSPVNGDKPITPATERTGQSNKGVKTAQTAVQTPTMENTTSGPVSAIVEVDMARHLFELESQKSGALDSAISSPEEARSLLHKILDQFNSSPELALHSQGSKSASALANLLQTAPA